MSVRTWLGAVLVAAAALLVAPGPALAVPTADIPDDVLALLDGEGLRTLLPEPDDATDASVHADAVHEVYAFTPDFLRGGRTDVAVAATGEWIACLRRGEVVLGTVRIDKPHGGTAALAGADRDVDLGLTLTDLDTGELVIEEAESGALFGLDGNTVRPLNGWARLELARPARLAELQELLTARGDEDSDSWLSHAGWLRLAGGVGIVALLLAAGTVVLLRPRTGRRAEGE